MRKLRFTYRTSLKFENPVKCHNFALRCVPQSNQVQTVHIEERYVYPADCINEVVDGFGNHKYVGRIADYHTTFEYGVRGVAEVESMKEQEEPLWGIYKYPSPFTEITAPLEAFFEPFAGMEGDNITKTVCMMNRLYDALIYEAGSTDIYTPAGEALEKITGSSRCMSKRYSTRQ